MANGKILLFNRWASEGVEVPDLGLKNHINLKPIILPRSEGKHGTRPFHKNDMHIVERLVNKLAVPGHRGKKHKTTSGHCVGQAERLSLAVRNAFEMIEQRTKKNPIQVLVQAIINSAPYEEVAAYRLGGIIARKAVIVAPQRRLDLALRMLSQGIYRISFKNRMSLEEVIARELITTADNDLKAHGVKERQRLEKEAEGAR